MQTTASKNVPKQSPSSGTPCAKALVKTPTPTVCQGSQIQDICVALSETLNAPLVTLEAHRQKFPTEIDSGPPFDRVIVYRHLLI